jgi:hypothetical protein
MYYTLCTMQGLSFRPDMVKIKNNLDSLIGELRKIIPAGVDPKQALIQGLMNTLCQIYDVQDVHDIVKAIALDPNFWAAQAKQKSARVIL